MIKVYDPEEKQFKTNGLGTMQPLSCVETKKKGLEGWKLEIKASIEHKELLVKDNIVMAQTKEKGAQAFRLQEPKISNKQIEITANHVFYDADSLILVDVRPEEKSAVDYMRWCNDRTDTTSPFTFSGDAEGVGTNYFIRRTLLEAMEQAQETFHAVFDCNNFSLAIMKKVGNDNGYKVAYGKDIQGIKVEQSWKDVVTKILPVGTNGLMLPEEFLKADISYKVPYTKIIKFDVPESDKDGNNIPEKTRIETLRGMAQDYLNANKYPKISYEVKADVPQDLSIGDTIHIKHPLVDIPAEVQGYTYDCNSKRVKSITFGNYNVSNSNFYQSSVKSAVNSAVGDIKDSIGNQNQRIGAVDEAVAKMGEEIKNSSGFYMTTFEKDNATIVYMHNKKKLEDSQLIWRASAEVLSVSTDGGTSWNAAIDASGDAIVKTLSTNGVNADWIKAGTISGISFLTNTRKKLDEDVIGLYIGSDGLDYCWNASNEYIENVYGHLRITGNAFKIMVSGTTVFYCDAEVRHFGGNVGPHVYVPTLMYDTLVNKNEP